MRVRVCRIGSGVEDGGRVRFRVRVEFALGSGLNMTE